jgi:group I intron endonuclease
MVHTSIGVVAFPANSPSFKNPLESKHQICFDFRNQRGCYLCTHKKSGKQYIGSSINLSSRLSEYYRAGYLKLQSTRGSAISRAIIKHGLNEFSLAILVLRDSLEQKTNYSSNNLPDFVVLEQSYLDNYTLAYNVNRVASSGYEPSKSSVNKGAYNPSYGLKAEQAFVWDRTHTEELKSRWYMARGKYTLFMYSAKTFKFIESFPSAVRLSVYFNVSVSFGVKLVKLIQTSDYPAVIYKDYIISLTPLDIHFLSSNLNLFSVFNPKINQRSGRSIIIYGFNPSTKELRT